MSTQLIQRVRGTMRSAYATVPAIFHYTALGVILYGLRLSKLTNGRIWEISIVLTLPCLMLFKTWRKPLSRFRPVRLRRIPYVDECRIYIEHYFHSSKRAHLPPLIIPIQRTEYLGPSIVDLLPQEIIDRIIDCLAPDGPLLSCPPRSKKICKTNQGLAMPNLAIPDFTLLSCALVCQAFRHRSQYHMWRSVHVRSASRLNKAVSSLKSMGMAHDISLQTLAGKARLLQDHPRFACAVKHIQVCLSSSSIESDRCVETNDAKALLQILTETGATINSICLQMRNSPKHDADDLFDLLIGPHFDRSSVTALHLRDIAQFPLSFLGKFSSLRSLSFTSVEQTDSRFINDNDNDAAAFRHLPHIEALSIGDNSIVAVLLMLGMVPSADGGFVKANTVYLDTSRLLHLDLIYTDLHPLLESGLEEVTALLEVVGSTVTHLKYTFDQFCMGGPDLNYANLRQTPALRVLDVVFSCEWPDTSPTPHAGEMSISVGSLSAFLSNLAPGMLETLNITFAHLFCRDARYPPKSILSMEWHRLDGEVRRIYGTSEIDRRLKVNLHINYMGAHPDVNPIQIGGGGGIGVTPVYAKWRAMTKAACYQLFVVELPRQFPLSNACPGIKINASHSTGTTDAFIDILTDLSSRGISA